MTDSLRSVLPRPVAIFLIAGCLAAYAASPKDADDQLAYARGSMGAAVAMRPPSRLANVDGGSAGRLLQAGVFAVIDRGPWPLAGAIAVPMLALVLRRRCES